MTRENSSFAPRVDEEDAEDERADADEPPPEKEPDDLSRSLSLSEREVSEGSEL